MDQLTILAEDIVHLEYCTTQGSISVDICINLDDVSFTNISMNVVLYVCEVLHWNVNPENRYFDWGLCGFPQSL